MSKSKQYILTGKGSIANDAVRYEKGAIVTAAELKKLNKRQQGFFEEFDEANKKHLKFSKVHFDAPVEKPEALDLDEVLGDSNSDESEEAEHEMAAKDSPATDAETEAPIEEPSKQKK